MSDPSESIPAARREVRDIPVIPGYQIEAVAGETTSTQSWEALQISLDRRVVLLTLKVELVDDPAKVAHFEDIARIVARLRHRNIISIIDIAKTESGLPYVVMEKIEGRRLSEVLHHDGPLPPARAAKVVMQLAEALDGAWKHSGFIHRNLKPENVFLLPDDAAKISSFMYATVVRPGADPLAADGGMLVGTPNYMPPEQIDGLRSIDFHADIYSVGALFYQVLTGRPPFAEERDYMRIFDLQKNGTIPAPSDIDPSIPVDYSRIVQKMMAKRPGERYAFWQDVIEDLHRATAGRDLYVPGGGAWVSPYSTVADPAPRAEPEPVAVKGKAKGLKIGGAARLRRPGGPAAAAPAPAAPRVVLKKPMTAADAPAAPLRAAPPIRAAGVAAEPAAATAAKPGIVVGAPAVVGAPFASDGETRRSEPVAADVVAPDAAGAWATPESAYVPPADAAPRKKGAGIAASILAFLLVARPPLLVRVVGSLLLLAVVVGAAWLRIGALESVPPADPRDPSSIKAVAPRPGKPIQVAKPIAATIRPAPEPEPEPVPEERQADVAAAQPSEPAPPPVETASTKSPAAEKAPPPKPPKEEVAKRLPLDLYEDALYHIAKDLRNKSWADAKSSSLRALRDVAGRVPEKAAPCNALAAAFGTAQSWEDLAAMTMFDHPRKREITLGRTKHTILPTGTMPGRLICDRIVNGTTLRNQQLDLSKMDNRQKWAIVRAERPAAEPAALYSRAFLTLAFGSEKEFRALVDKFSDIAVMKEFYLVYELHRN